MRRRAVAGVVFLAAMGILAACQLWGRERRPPIIMVSNSLGHAMTEAEIKQLARPVEAWTKPLTWVYGWPWVFLARESSQTAKNPWHPATPAGQAWARERSLFITNPWAITRGRVSYNLPALLADTALCTAVAAGLAGLVALTGGRNKAPPSLTP
jgi:hypothetical protein